MGEREDALLNEALKRYGLTGARCEFIRHNENMTFRVDDKYLLRVHLHRPGFTTGCLREGLDNENMRREELKLISRLASLGMRVQTPIPNSEGDMVSRLSGGVLATLLTWLDGRALTNADLTPAIAEDIGRMIGRMHNCLIDHAAPDAIRYDALLCARMARELASEPIIPDAQRKIILDALSKIGGALALKESKFAPVHSDLSLSNMLLTPEGIVPIDFSLFGTGLRMMDIGAAYCHILDDDCRERLARSYMDTGLTLNFHEIDMMFALNILLYISIHARMNAAADWFSKMLHNWCETVFEPVARGDIITSAAFIEKFMIE